MVLLHLNEVLAPKIDEYDFQAYLEADFEYTILSKDKDSKKKQKISRILVTVLRDKGGANYLCRIE